MALELHTHWVVLDDSPARRLAFRIGLPVIGTLSLLVAAKRAALLPAVRPSVEALITVGFYLAQDVVTDTLTEAG